MISINIVNMLDIFDGEVEFKDWEGFVVSKRADLSIIEHAVIEVLNHLDIYSKDEALEAETYPFCDNVKFYTQDKLNSVCQAIANFAGDISAIDKTISFGSEYRLATK